MQKPLVSIILATYNGNHNWISEAINSVLTQSYDSFEFIIINDASTNDIEKTILGFLKKDERIVYFKNEKNLERSASRNKGINASKGKYIAVIDDDDIWCDTDKLQKQVDFMEQNTEYGLCGTGVILIDEDGKEFDRVLQRSGDENIKKYISGSNQFAHSSIIMRKDILDIIGLYDMNYKSAQDYDLIMRIGRVSKINNLEIYGLKYRVRSGSISGKNAFKQQLNAFRIYLQYKNNYPNKFQGFLKHLISTFMPKWVVGFLVRVYKFNEK